MGLGVQSGYPNATAQERVNCYLESLTDAEKTRVVCLGMPGLKLFTNSLGDTPVRGMYQFGEYLYISHKQNVYRCDNAGSLLKIGEIGTTSGRVGISCNSTQLCVVDGTTSGYVYNIADDAVVSISVASPTVITDTAHGLPEGAAIRFSTTGTLPTGISANTTYYVKNVATDSYNIASTRGGTAINVTAGGAGIHTRTTYLAAITAAGFPGGVSIDFLDGYLIVNRPDSQSYFISGLYDALSWSALDFASAESNPDNLLRVFVDHSQLMLLGKYTTEMHADSGAQQFPFVRNGFAIDWGIVGPWSIARLDNSVAFLARKRMGEVQVVMYTGGTPRRISTHDIERILNSYPYIDSATAFSFTLDGHPMYVINVAERTFMYDLASDCWSSLKGWNLNRYRGEIGEPFGNKTVIADYENGNLYYLDRDTHTDNDEPQVMSITGKHLFNSIDRLTVNEINIDMSMGVGTVSGQGENPQIGMSYSKDGGNSWSNVRFAGMGKIGKYGNLVRFGQLGQCRDLVVKLEISDPVKRCINAVYADIEADND